MKFDHTKKYYCVIQKDSDSKIDEEIEKGDGVIKSDEPVIHFDSIKNIGKFLYLGNGVRELKIPEDATIISNEEEPYSYSSDKAELFETLGCEDIINKIKELENTSNVEINISDHKFTGDFAFPGSLNSLTLTRCHIPPKMKLPEKVSSYHADSCKFKTFKVVPQGSIGNIFISRADIYECDFASESGGHVSVSKSEISEMMFTGKAESINISESNLRDVHFAEGTESVVISDSDIKEVNFPSRIEYLFFINSNIGENIKLPEKVGTFRVLGCSYTSDEVKKEMDELRNISEW